MGLIESRVCQECVEIFRTDVLAKERIEEKEYRWFVGDILAYLFKCRSVKFGKHNKKAVKHQSWKNLVE